MTEKKLTEAQIRAQKKYDLENKEKRNYLKTRSAARSFIKKKASIEDLKELDELIKEQLKEVE